MTIKAHHYVKYTAVTGEGDQCILLTDDDVLLYTRGDTIVSSVEAPHPDAFQNAWDIFPFKTIEDTIRHQLLEREIKGPIVVLCAERGVLEINNNFVTLHPINNIYNVGDIYPPVTLFPDLDKGLTPKALKFLNALTGSKTNPSTEELRSKDNEH